VTGSKGASAGFLAPAARLAQIGWDWAGLAFDGLLFPATCPVCHAETGGPAFCDDCQAELLGARGLVCPRCAMPVGPHPDLLGGCSECRGRSLGFDRAIALGPYQGPIRHLCLALKHEPNAWIARWLAELVVESCSESISAELAAEPGPAPWVVPVPLHWWRRMRRGYNQAEALAESVARPLGLKSRRLLRRVSSTPTLARVGRSERAKLMREAFQVSRPAGLAGRTVLLVDDILTTGATCGAAARALKRAGASRVVAVVVARAEGKP
jgi:ComF family protein